MKKLLFCTICIATALMMISCGGKQDGPAGEVLSKKTFSQVCIKYDSVGDFYDGVAVVSVDWNKYGVINTKGEEIVPCNYRSIKNCQDGMLLFNDDYKYGFLNTSGTIVVEAGKYEDINDFSCGLAGVKKDGKWGFINKKGEEVIPPTFEVVGVFAENLALVRVNRKYGYIDVKGNFVIEPSFDDAEEFSCGVAITTKGNNDYVIDTKGNIIYTADKTTVLLDDWFESNMVPVLKEQGRSYVAGYINTKGEIAIPFEYQYATEFIDGTALVLKDNKVYTINTKGEILGEETSPEVLEEFLDDATYFIDLSADVLVKLLGEEYFEDLDW